MLFKITTSDFYYNGKLFPEGISIDLPDSEARKFPEILLPVSTKEKINDPSPVSKVESITIELPKRSRKKK